MRFADKRPRYKRNGRDSAIELLSAKCKAPQTVGLNESIPLTFKWLGKRKFDPDVYAESEFRTFWAAKCGARGILFATSFTIPHHCVRFEFCQEFG